MGRGPVQWVFRVILVLKCLQIHLFYTVGCINLRSDDGCKLAFVSEVQPKKVHTLGAY